MKVLQLLPELKQGGVERGTVDTARALVAMGHVSHVVSAGGALVAQLEREGSSHHSIAVHRKRLSSLCSVKPLRQLIVNLEPSKAIMHGNNHRHKHNKHSKTLAASSMFTRNRPWPAI